MSKHYPILHTVPKQCVLAQKKKKTELLYTACWLCFTTKVLKRHCKSFQPRGNPSLRFQNPAVSQKYSKTNTNIATAKQRAECCCAAHTGFTSTVLVKRHVSARSHRHKCKKTKQRHISEPRLLYRKQHFEGKETRTELLNFQIQIRCTAIHAWLARKQAGRITCIAEGCETNTSQRTKAVVSLSEASPWPSAQAQRHRRQNRAKKI